MDCFGEIDCLGRTHHIELKPEAVPFALKDKVNDEIHRMEMGVIEKVEEPTELPIYVGGSRKTECKNPPMSRPEEPQ